jgi:hypothetical protein
VTSSGETLLTSPDPLLRKGASCFPPRRPTAPVSNVCQKSAGNLCQLGTREAPHGPSSENTCQPSRGGGQADAPAATSATALNHSSATATVCALSKSSPVTSGKRHCASAAASSPVTVSLAIRSRSPARNARAILARAQATSHFSALHRASLGART